LEAKAREFLESLLSTPGVSGYEEPVQAVVRDYAAPFADHVATDLHGNVILGSNPGSDLRVMFAGHCDQLGLIVSHIDENGFLYFQTIGGWDPQQLVGQRVSIWTDDGEVTGVVARKAIHLLEKSEREKVVEFKELWIDIGARDQADASSAVRIGDSVTVQLGLQDLKNGLVSAPALDNRTGVWVVVEGLRRAATRELDCALYAVSTVQEELGLRGARTSAFGVDPHVGIAVDVTHATDCPSIDKRQRGNIDLGGGPVIVRGPNINPKVGRMLREIADTEGIPSQHAALGRAAPNDANPLQITRAGVATGLVQIPNRYMHSAVETASLDDLDHAADLLAQFACAISAEADFTP
jgi:putative aminopeptidase FrvX